MNRVRYAVTVLLLPALILAADFAAGVKVGLNLTQFWGDDADDAGLGDDFLAGFTGGGFVCLSLNDVIAVEPGLFYSMRGAKYEIVVDVFGVHSETEFRFRLHYLELPLLVRVSMPLDAPVRPFCAAGISPGILLDAESRLETDGEATTDDVDDDEFETFDFAVPMGAGVIVDAGPGMLLFEFRFVPGLTTIDDDGDGDPDTERAEMRNRGLSFLVGYSF